MDLGWEFFSTNVSRPYVPLSVYKSGDEKVEKLVYTDRFGKKLDYKYGYFAIRYVLLEVLILRK